MKEQQIYDSGLIDGRSIAKEELRLLREQLVTTQAQLYTSNSVELTKQKEINQKYKNLKNKKI